MSLASAPAAASRILVSFQTSSSAGTVRYTVPDGKTFYATVWGDVTADCRINGTTITASRNAGYAVMEWVLVSGTTIADGTNAGTSFVGYLE